jgi:RNA polymerase sigma-70 factor, ECF subfamily
MMKPTDDELMVRAQTGDVGAFHELTLRYRAPLRRFFAALLADPTQADDAVQETFLRLWTLRDRYAPTGKFAAYLFQIGRHYGLNQRKKFRPETRQCTIDETLEIVAPPVTQPERVLLEQVRKAQIRRAISELPEHYRSVFLLSHEEGIPYAEIAARLGIPLGTVKSRMAEAVRRLRLRLSAETEQEEERKCK